MDGYGLPLDQWEQAKSDWEMFAVVVASGATQKSLTSQLAKWIGIEVMSAPSLRLYEVDAGSWNGGAYFEVRPVPGGMSVLLAL